MISNRRTPILIGILLLLILAPWSHALAAEVSLPQPTVEFYVYDGADMISGETAQYIIQTNQALYQQTEAQIVVATIPSLQGEVIEEYGNALYRHWGIGSAQKNNGVLLLVSQEDRQVWIEVGYGLEGAIPDGRAGGILDQYIIPYFQQEQYDQGILHGYQALLNAVEEEYQVQISPQGAPKYQQQKPSQEDQRRMSPLQKILMIAAVIVFLFIDFTFFRGLLTFSLLRSFSRGGFRGGGRNRGGGGSSGGGGAGRGW